MPRSSFAAVRQRAQFTGGYPLFAYAALVLAVVLALGTFAYDRVLAGMQTSRDAELAKAEKAIDLATIEGFIQLRNRLNSGTTLLSSHVALSGFFTLLSSVVPTTVRLSSLHLSLDATGKVRLEGAGVARSFNALAAVSTAFATDGRIKDAIFSNLVVNRDNTVSFSLSATLDPKVVAFTP